MRTRLLLLLVLASAAVLAACGESDPFEPGGPTLNAPGSLEGRYEWVLDGWIDAAPAGQATVQLTWAPPTGWRGEPFRIYGRRGSAGTHRLMATVTACSEGLCRYADPDIVGGQRYEYYVAVVDERAGREVTTPTSIRVDVPTYARPPRPSAPAVVALDNMLYLHWTDVALPDDRIWKYLVFMERRDRQGFFQPGETDGVAFVDGLARNGFSYRYALAVVDTDGHVSERSAWSEWRIPRPDARGALVYALADSAQASGFRFDPAARTARVVSGTAADAHWRLEASAEGWFLQPLGGTGVRDAGFTTALVCGPASDTDCVAVTEAPTTGYQEARIPLTLEHTYLLRLPGATPNYAKLRVGILAFGQQDRRLMIFDWALQTVAGERGLAVER
jgi:hypothetical protein